MDRLSTARSSPSDASAPDEVTTEAVAALLRALGRALRSYRLYDGAGPMVERFVETLQQRFAALWEDLPALRLEIDEARIRWHDEVVYPTGDATAELPFLFYKDGIQELIFYPGFETRDLQIFLDVLARAPQLRSDADDLVTVLWEKDLSCLHYRYVDVSEGVPLPEAPEGTPEPVRAEEVRSEVVNEAATPAIAPEDFQEALYFLEEGELRRLEEEVRRESERDLWNDVLAGLLDRLEEGGPERQARVMRVLADVLPSLLGAGRLQHVTGLLRELADIAGRESTLAPDVLQEVRALFELLAREETIGELIRLLEDAPGAVAGEALEEFFEYLPPSAIAPLMRISGSSVRPDVRRALDRATERLAAGNRNEVLVLLGSSDAPLAAGAARWAGRLGIGAAVDPLSRLLRHADPGVRVAAVEALSELRASTVAEEIVSLLEDPDREVRVAAARALGRLAYASARVPLREAIRSKRLRSAERSEKIAFFEAFGRLASSEDVALLDRMLNGRRWLGRGESPETRACAALGLGQARHPAAQEALETAAEDDDAVVRSAVVRALRKETS